MAGRIGGNGGRSAAESPCDETTNIQNIVFVLKIACWPLSRVANHRTREESKPEKPIGLGRITLPEQMAARNSWAPTDARKHVHRLGGTLHLD